MVGAASGGTDTITVTFTLGGKKTNGAVDATVASAPVATTTSFTGTSVFTNSDAVGATKDVVVTITAIAKDTVLTFTLADQ